MCEPVKDIVRMTHEMEMVGFLKTNGRSSRFVSLLTRTPVVKIRAGNPFHQISKGAVVGEPKLFKVSCKLGLINANYNASVRRRVAEAMGVKPEEVEYENGPVWFHHLSDGSGGTVPCLGEKTEEPNKGKIYLLYFPHKSENSYVNDQGEPVADAVVKPWLYKESARPDFKPSFITLKLENVLEMRASGLVIQTSEDVELAEKALAQS